MEQTKDYSLLRPFDLEAAKNGAAICYNEDGAYESATYLADPGPDGDIAIRDHMGNCYVEPMYSLHMAPLAWVEGKPVYKGDVLYHRTIGALVIKGANAQCELQRENSIGCYISVNNNGITWNKPRVKKSGWINVYNTQSSICIAICSDVYPTKETADLQQADNRKACIEIFWEE